jgi:hypothetical protein
MSRKSHEPSPAEAPLSRELVFRPVRFKHVAPIVTTDLPLLWAIADRVDARTLQTSLISRHRANPKGIGPSFRYDVSQQNDRFPFPEVCLYELDDRKISADKPDLIVRDYSSAAAVTDTSWELRIWTPERGNPSAQLGEFTPGSLDTVRDIGALSIGIKMAIEQAAS